MMLPVVGSAESQRLRRELVDVLMRDGHLRSSHLAEAFIAVPRELFVPEASLEDAYRSSEAIVVKRIDGIGVSSASAPDVVAFMLEQLDVQPRQHVLEIGAGTGYNAALLGHVVGPRGKVITIDIDEDLVFAARQHLDEAQVTNVEVVQADGALGFASASQPFDRIILTVAARDIVPAWRDQLAPGHGRLVMPLVLRGPQRCVAFVRALDHLTSVSVRGCSFIPLRGLLATDLQRVPLNEEGSLVISMPESVAPLAVRPAIEGLEASLTAPHVIWHSDVTSSAEAVRNGLELWLVAHDASACSIWGAPIERSPLPDLFGSPERYRGTVGVIDPTGVAVLVWRGRELCIRAATGADAPAARLLELTRAWDTAGQPRDVDLSIRAFPSSSEYVAEAAHVTIEQRWTRFVLTWSS